jgi:hypothetical protein
LDLQRKYYEEQLEDEDHSQIHSDIIVFIILSFITIFKGNFGVEVILAKPE